MNFIDELSELCKRHRAKLIFPEGLAKPKIIEAQIYYIRADDGPNVQSIPIATMAVPVDRDREQPDRLTI